jgi:hypothetical protein
MKNFLQLLTQGFDKLKKNSLSSRNFLLNIQQRLIGYGRYIGYHSDNVLTVYTEKDQGRISLNDIAKHVLVNNETIVVEYYDKKLFLGTSIFIVGGLLYCGYYLRRYIRYRVFKANSNVITN